MCSPQTARNRAIDQAVRMILDLLRCVTWLIRQGVFITGFRGWHGTFADHVTVTVAASPWLYTLFSGEAESLQRRQEGCLVIHTWVAHRYNTRIEWEEVCPYPHA